MADSASEELTRRLLQYPPGALQFFKNAFSLAAALNEDAREKVLVALIKNFRSGRRQLSGQALTSITGVGSTLSEQIASVFSLLVGLFSETDATPDDLISAMGTRWFDEKDEGAVRDIASSVCAHRSEINGVVERAQLAGVVLPALDSFSVAVDLRVKIVDGKVRLKVPVAVIHIETDIETHFSFQLSEGDVEDLAKTLTNTLAEMKVAEQLGEQR